MFRRRFCFNGFRESLKNRGFFFQIEYFRIFKSCIKMLFCHVNRVGLYWHFSEKTTLYCHVTAKRSILIGRRENIPFTFWILQFFFYETSCNMFGLSCALKMFGFRKTEDIQFITTQQTQGHFVVLGLNFKQNRTRRTETDIKQAP